MPEYRVQDTRFPSEGYEEILADSPRKALDTFIRMRRVASYLGQGKARITVDCGFKRSTFFVEVDVEQAADIVMGPVTTKSSLEPEQNW